MKMPKRTRKNKGLIARIMSVFAKPVLLHYLLPVFMIFLIAGTVSQKYIGLYAATQIFFYAKIIWVYGVPLPGLPIFLGLLILNLAGKLIFKSPWTKRNSGVIVCHMAVLFLFIGGMITGMTSREGYIDLAPLETKDYTADYHIREFVVLNADGQEVYSASHKDLSAGDHIISPDLPFQILVIEACLNCKIIEQSDDSSDALGMAKHMTLIPKAPERENEENLSGIVFEVQSGDIKHVLLSLEDVLEYPEFVIDNNIYRFMVRRQRRDLPFSVTLLDFKRDMHKGTALAKSYESRLLINDGGVRWESVISMNEPLRYKGYTVYQSSFVETQSGDISVLAVVWNIGRIIPYISGIMLCLGLILHLGMRRQKYAP